MNEIHPMLNANLYALFESRFPADRTACCTETHDGLYYSWNDLDRATAKIANLLKNLDLHKARASLPAVSSTWLERVAHQRSLKMDKAVMNMAILKQLVKTSSIPF